jgi:hypothetical protein
MGFVYRKDRFLAALVTKMYPKTGFLGTCMALKACCRRGAQPPVGTEDIKYINRLIP